MTNINPHRPDKTSRLAKLYKLEEQIRYEQLGEEDFEYREHLEALRLRVLAEIKLEKQRNAPKSAVLS